MAKFRFRSESKKSCHRLKPESPQGEVNPGGRQQPQLCVEKITASIPFPRRRSVIGRNALHRSSDPDTFKFQTIFPAHAGLPTPPSRPPKRAIQPASRLISREHSASPVGAMSPGGQSDNHNPRLRIPPPRHRLTPVPLLSVGRFFFLRHFLPPANQSGAKTAGGNLPPETLQAHRPARGGIRQEVRPIQREICCRFRATMA